VRRQVGDGHDNDVIDPSIELLHPLQDGLNVLGSERAIWLGAIRAPTEKTWPMSRTRTRALDIHGVLTSSSCTRSMTDNGSALSTVVA